ncbi:hypothetical protein [Rhodococcus sp. NPDC047139]|uniref:hypothetical protein n=1 Tax=Rhodococcus sp. NPDC047139 TaxID=3155141 RepID=UPI0033FF3D64
MAPHDPPRHAVSTPADRHAILAAAAFGSAPGVNPLPAAHGAEQRWLRAVALGGQGRYAAARAELARLGRSDRDGVWSSLGASTEASLLRQLGGHRAAAVADGRALALSSPVDTGCESSVAAWCDATTGLAADALGRGRLTVCRTLLDECASVLDTAELAASDRLFVRQRIRLAWVGAESALAAGDFVRARSYADRAVELAAGFGSVRHSVKSDLVKAASLTGRPDREPAAALAAEVLRRADEHGLVPLHWAAAMLLDGLGAGDDAGRVRDLSATLVVRRGGRFVTASRG